MGTAPVNSTESEVIKTVRWRFRLCRYMFNLGALWILAGGLLHLLAARFGGDFTFPEIIQWVGFAIFSAAFALTLAIYRCPVCDRYLSRFRPRKELCPNCGAGRSDDLFSVPTW
jgi:quinol-cytochrome oxidoreductase complex cytochrome b subunit